MFGSLLSSITNNVITHAVNTGNAYDQSCVCRHLTIYLLNSLLININYLFPLPSVPRKELILLLLSTLNQWYVYRQTLSTQNKQWILPTRKNGNYHYLRKRKQLRSFDHKTNKKLFEKLSQWNQLSCQVQ